MNALFFCSPLPLFVESDCFELVNALSHKSLDLSEFADFFEDIEVLAMSASVHGLAHRLAKSLCCMAIRGVVLCPIVLHYLEMGWGFIYYRY